jgi:Sulfotransferase family
MAFLDKIFGSGRGKPIVVVSGLPRSGTSMAMKMIEAAGFEVVQDGIRTADTDNPKGYYELEQVKDLDKPGSKAWLRQHRGKVVKVISFLLRDLPYDNDYRIVFMHRKIEEVLASQQKMLERRGEANESTDDRMAEVYQDHLAKVMNLIKARDNFECLELHYSEILADGPGQAKRMADFLGVPEKAGAMAAQVDQALYRNRAQ